VAGAGGTYLAVPEHVGARGAFLDQYSPLAMLSKLSSIHVGLPALLARMLTIMKTHDDYGSWTRLHFGNKVDRKSFVKSMMVILNIYCVGDSGEREVS
jgi:hypothetical protein